jgi:hypothetical protein
MTTLRRDQNKARRIARLAYPVQTNHTRRRLRDFSADTQATVRERLLEDGRSRHVCDGMWKISTSTRPPAAEATDP